MDSNKSKRVVLYCRVATQTQLADDHILSLGTIIQKMSDNFKLCNKNMSDFYRHKSIFIFSRFVLLC